jgi:hypothetical protein
MDRGKLQGQSSSSLLLSCAHLQLGAVLGSHFERHSQAVLLLCMLPSSSSSWHFLLLLLLLLWVNEWLLQGW